MTSDLPHPFGIQLAIDEAMLAKMMDKPCLIKIHPIGYKRLAHLFPALETKGHRIEPCEDVELDRVWVERLEDSNG